MKYSHHQTKYIGKWVGLRTYQHPCNILISNAKTSLTEAETFRIGKVRSLEKCVHLNFRSPQVCSIYSYGWLWYILTEHKMY